MTDLLQLFIIRSTTTEQNLATAVPLTAVKKLKAEKVISEKDSVVCIVTGIGLKNVGLLESQNLKISNSKLENLAEMVRYLRSVRVA